MWLYLQTFLAVYFLSSWLTCAENSRNVNGKLPSCFQKSQVVSINNLGFNLLNRRISSTGNIFISPAGVAFALGMIHLGSSNETQQEIEKAMSYGEGEFSGSEFHSGLQELLENFHENNSNFSVWNGIFVQDDYQIKGGYASNLNKFYQADIQFMNFTNDLETALEGINDFVRNKTNGKFDVMLQETVPNDTKIIVLNAVDFNDDWKVQFLPEKTERDYFYSGRRETTEVWMMSMEAETFKFYEDLEMRYKFLELPYKDDKMSMILALPTQYDQPADLQMDPSLYCEIKSRMIPTKLDIVSIPKFKFEFQRSLKDDLIEIGIENAFNSTFDNMLEIQKEDLYITDIIQKTIVEACENGSEAASITKLKFMPVAFRGVKEFIANHPFLFYVEDKRSGVILVTGKVDEPSESISMSENLRFI